MQTKQFVPVLATLSLLIGAIVVANGVKFHDLSYEEAVARATVEEKIVFIDFFTTWCAPCKEMDRTTFQDPKVAAWLAEHAIALKVDAEKNEANEALAARFNVKSFPNYIYLTPQGGILDRITGKMDSKEFLQVSGSVMEGENSVTRALRALAQGDQNDPNLRRQLANAYWEIGRFEDALHEYLWCFDEGHKHSPAFMGSRLSFLLVDLTVLSESFPTAREALYERREEAKQNIIDGEMDIDNVLVFTRINDSLGENTETLALFDKLKNDGVLRANVAQIFVHHIFDLLLEAKRYDEIVAYLDVVERASLQFEMLDDEVKLEEEYQTSSDEALFNEVLSGHTLLTRQSVAASYEILIGVGEVEEAASLANELIRRLDDAETLNALAWAGYRTGSPTEENLTMAREAYIQTSGEELSIVNTYARLLAGLDQRVEAITVAEQGLALAANDEERILMENCLEYCKG